ncbi:MAG: hypothetical protein KAW41_07015 [Candidatus Diapherotrites archaeon]|nr:hypothetical protein [Candidatus Diapherotrites archaeon]
MGKMRSWGKKKREPQVAMRMGFKEDLATKKDKGKRIRDTLVEPGARLPEQKALPPAPAEIEAELEKVSTARKVWPFGGDKDNLVDKGEIYQALLRRARDVPLIYKKLMNSHHGIIEGRPHENIYILTLRVRPLYKKSLGEQVDVRWLPKKPWEWVQAAKVYFTKENILSKLWSPNPDDVTHFGSEVMIVHDREPDETQEFVTDYSPDPRYGTFNRNRYRHSVRSRRTDTIDKIYENREVENTFDVHMLIGQSTMDPKSKVKKRVGKDMVVRGGLYVKPDIELLNLIEGSVRPLIPKTLRKKTFEAIQAMRKKQYDFATTGIELLPKLVGVE